MYLISMKEEIMLPTNVLQSGIDGSAPCILLYLKKKNEKSKNANLSILFMEEEKKNVASGQGK